MKRLATFAILIFSATVVIGTSGAATIEVNETAAMEGSFGLEVVCDGVDTSSAYVQDDSPNQESTYRASFLFNPAQVQITQTGFILESRHFIFTASGGSVNQPQNLRVIGVYLLKKSGKYWVAAQGVNTAAGKRKATPKILLGDAGVENNPHFVEVEWQASPVAGGYGTLRLRVDGGSWAEIVDLKNNTQVIDLARLGIVIGLDVDTVGSHYFDDFQSFRTLSP